MSKNEFRKYLTLLNEWGYKTAVSRAELAGYFGVSPATINYVINRNESNTHFKGIDGNPYYKVYVIDHIIRAYKSFQPKGWDILATKLEDIDLDTLVEYFGLDFRDKTRRRNVLLKQPPKKRNGKTNIRYMLYQKIYLFEKLKELADDETL